VVFFDRCALSIVHDPIHGQAGMRQAQTRSLLFGQLPHSSGYRYFVQRPIHLPLLQRANGDESPQASLLKKKSTLSQD
jgi:hypothetical protein